MGVGFYFINGDLFKKRVALLLWQPICGNDDIIPFFD